MSPPISKDLWLAAAITSTTLPTALAQPAPPTGSAPPSPVGIVAAVTPGAQIKSNDQILYVGSNALPGQRITTGKDEVLHVLLQDQSALTLGPESELVIDEFRYDESARKGKIRLNLRQGLVRVVGGYISKNEPTAIKTPHALVEISGGISTIETRPNGDYNSTFLFGQHMNVQGNDGQTRSVTRPGFGVSSNNGQTGPIQRTNVVQLNGQLRQLGNVNQNTTNPQGSGMLISTSHTGGPNAQKSPSSLSNDRVNKAVTNNTNTDTSQTVRNVLGSGQSTVAS